MRALPREGEEQVDAANGHDALDSVRSWLASGAQLVDRRRRFGRHGRTRKLLVVDPAARPNASDGWHSTTSALQRHTVGGALSELDPQHRRVITLAYLEGQSNRQIAATLGVSVATARRRLWKALERLEMYVSAAGAWLAALLVGFSVYVLSRLARVVESADTAQRVAATVTVGVLAAAAVGVITIIPSTSAPLNALPKAAAPVAPGLEVIVPWASISAAQGIEQAPDQQVLRNAKKHIADAIVAPTTGGGSSSNGCQRLTGAPPAVPVGSRSAHPTGPPVNPLKGGCKNH
jgi:DNA-binding NarL/FixJ family response regulator